MTREEYLAREIAALKAGGETLLWCVMGTPERVAAGLCRGAIPSNRLSHGGDTCSSECQADKRRLRRWLKARSRCRLCGKPLPKSQQPLSQPVRSAQQALRKPVDTLKIQDRASSGRKSPTGRRKQAAKAAKEVKKIG